MTIILVGVVLLVILFYCFLAKRYNYWKERGVKQGKPIWILGDAWKQVFKLEDPGEMIKNIYNMCPGTRYSGIYQFLLPTLVIKDPELIKQVTVKDFEHFVDHRNFMPEDVDPLWGKNIFALEGKKWRHMRSLLTPTFTSSKLKTIFVLIKEYAEKVAQLLLKKDKEIIKVDVKDFFTRITNDIIATGTFGIMVDSLSKPSNIFYTMGKKLTDFKALRLKMIVFGNLLFPNLHKILKTPLFSQETRTYFTQIINESIQIREEKELERPDMINLLVQARRNAQKEYGVDKNGSAGHVKTLEKEMAPANITNEDIASQALLFFFGGFDSVSNVMCFSAYELMVHEDIQSKLRKEIYETLEVYGDNITYERIAKMKYMDMVLSETLRKWPNFVSLDRICTKPYVIEPDTPDEKPLYVEKGSVITIPLYGIHYDPKYYPDPERFDPERFSDENEGNINPYAYFPFGLGPRNCLGARFATIEIKAVLFYILMHFELVPVEETVIPVRVSKADFSLQPDRLKIGLKRIKKE